MIEPYYESDRFVLYHADCRDLLDRLPEGSIDLIFADPPYNLSNGGFTCHSGKRTSVNKGVWDVSRGTDEDLAFHLAWINKCRRVLAPNGTIWISGTYHSIYACGYALAASGYHLLNDICWYKPNAPPNLSGRYLTASHETLIWARRDADARHTFNYALAKNGNWDEDALKRPGKQMRSVWSIPAPVPQEKVFGKHPTQKPLQLLRRIILLSSEEGDRVLDPFAGSSTTGLAAYACNREFIGIDTEKEYLDLSIKRFEKMKSEMSE
jgi:site-specific DNA-methyltransferase (adenine-specific)